MSGWQSGHAASCKAFYGGLIPTSATNINYINNINIEYNSLMNTTLYIVAGSSGLIGHYVCNKLNESSDKFIGLDAKEGKFSNIVDLSDQGKLIEIIDSHVDSNIKDISLIYSAGKNGTVEYGGLDDFGAYSQDNLSEYFFQNSVLPYSCSMSLINYAKEKNIKLKILILCSHYSFVAGTDALYNKSTSEIKKIKPHGYIISKHAVIGVIKSLASTYGSDRVLINGFAPGGISNNQDEEFVNKFKEYSPLKRLASPDEIAEWIYLIANPKLTYGNGSIFNIDGGVLIR